MNKECCATCEYWAEKYWLCKYHSRTTCEVGLYASPPEKVCEFYEKREAAHETQ